MFNDTMAVGGYGNDKALQVKVLLESAKIQGIDVTQDLYLTIIDKVYLTGSEKPPVPIVRKCSCE